MIDKYRLDDLRLESGEKGELARWVIQLQTDLDSERRKAGNSPVIPEGYADMLQRWMVFGRGMQNAGSELPRNLIAETEAMLSAPQQEVK